MKLIILQDKKTLNFNAFFMEAIALDQKAIPNTLFYKNYSNFTGAINFYELNGNLANGWLYTNGKATSTTNKAEMIKLNFNQSSERTGGNGKLMLADAGSMNCGRILVPHTRTECVGSGGVSQTGYDGDGGSMNCKNVIYYTSEINYCIIPSFDGIDDGGYFGGGGGSSSASPTSTQINNFILSQNSQIKYPRFTTLLKELKSFVQNDKAVLDALIKYSGFEKSKILEKLEFGKGPEINIKKLEGRYGYFLKSENPNVINIDEDWVRGLEIANLLSTKQATAFLLGVTVLHEFVHQARAENGLDRDWEYGTGFENMAFGLVITGDNAGNYSYRFYGK